MDSLIQYGLKNGSLVNIRKVKSGLECGCICPACNHLLVAKKGRNRKHHFAHYEVADCEYGLDTTIRYIAREILENSKKMILPDNVFSCGRDKYNYPQQQVIDIENVTIEKSLLLPIPEITIYSEGKAIKLEIIVTHDIDKRTYYKFRKLRIPTLKLDLNSLKATISSRNPKSVLKKYLLEDSSHTSWLYNKEEEMILAEFEDNVSSKKVVRKKRIDLVENCPVNEKDLTGYSTADFAKQCRKCKYMVDGILWDSDTNNPYILCSGEIGNSSFFSEWEKFKV